MEQPAVTTVQGSVLEVPVIDINGTDEAAIVKAVAKASTEWGVFQVVNHGIPEEVISNLQRVGREFFELPQEEKDKYAKEEGPDDDGGKNSIEGYGTKFKKETDGKKTWVDHLFHKIWPPSAINYKFWPQNPPSYREANEEYCKYLRGVSEKLFKYLSLGLRLKDTDLIEATGAGAGDQEEKEGGLVYLMKINYYPVCPRPDLALGVAAHTDMSYLTLLIPNDVAGLQVFRDGHWYDVKYILNAIIIHIGDQTEILSNGKYKAVLHRTTVNKERVRMSWPVFLEPPQEKEVGPHPKLVDDISNPPKYKTKKYADYMYCKFNKIPR